MALLATGSTMLTCAARRDFDGPDGGISAPCAELSSLMQLPAHPCNDVAKPAVRRLIIEPSRPNHRGFNDRRRKRQHPDRQRAMTHQLFRDAPRENGYHVRGYKNAHGGQEWCAQSYSTCEFAFRQGFVDEIGCMASRRNLKVRQSGKFVDRQFAVGRRMILA